MCGLRWILIVILWVCLAFLSPSAYAGLTDGLISYWMFDEACGLTAYDAVGANNGTINGATWTAGQISGALDFDGDDYVDLGNNPSLRPNLPLSISAWIKLNNLGSNHPITSLSNVFSDYYGVWFKINSDDLLVVSYGDGAGTGPSHRRTKKGNTALAADTWYHVTAVIRGPQDMDLYIDGADDGGTYSGTGGSLNYINGDSYIAVGVGGSSIYYADATLDEVKLYDRALSAAEAQQLYQGDSPRLLVVGNFESSGEPGGPFTPQSKNYQLTNLGPNLISWDITNTTAWLDISPASGTLDPNQSTTVTATLNSTANTLDYGLYTDTLVFNDITNSMEHTRVVILLINEILFVNGTCGNDSWSGTEPNCVAPDGPKVTIQAAIDAANDRDVVIVTEGTYTGTGNRDIDFNGKAMTLRSIDPEDPAVVAATIIDCEYESGHRGFNFHNSEGTDSVVSGLTVTNGYAEEGGGICCSGSSPTIENCVISNNIAHGYDGEHDSGSGLGGGIYCGSSSDATIKNCMITGNASEGGQETHGHGSAKGGGICCVSSSPTITGCTISNNNWLVDYSDGGGISCSESDPTIANCKIINNAESKRGGGIYCSRGSPTIINCLIVGNSVKESGGGIYFSSDYHTPKVINCTFTDNTAGLGGAICLTTTTATITNSILWGNSPTEIYGTATGTVIATYCDVKDGWPGAGNIDADPLFAFPGDYHLAFGSPCVDTGTNSPSGGLPETDLDGIARPFDGDYDDTAVADMGVYELHLDSATPTLALTPPSFKFTCPLNCPGPDPQILNIYNAGSDTLYWQITENCNWIDVTPDFGDSTGEVDEVVVTVDPCGLPADQYSYSLTVSDPCNVAKTILVPVTFRIGPTLLVPDEYSTIQSAINASFDGDQILVADGIYTGTGNRDIDFKGKAITVRSINGPSACIIDCQASSSDNHRGFYFHLGEDRDSILDGFTITNGYVSDGTWPQGGGIFCLHAGTRPTIQNCVITGNSAHDGGGIACNGGRPKIINCSITDNDAYPYYGGGIYHWNFANTAIIGCTISNNSAMYGGGGVFSGNKSTPTMTNSIVWSNTSESGGAQFGFQLNSTIYVSYSDIQGGRSGIGNINIDPGFVDAENGDYHLAVGSPCVDAGDPCFIPVPGQTDIDGESRLMGYRMDMGADEFPLFSPVIEILTADLEFFADTGDPNPPTQIISLRNFGGFGILDWAALENQSWLEVTPTSGYSSGEIDDITVSVDITGLSPANYYCDITISDPNAMNSPQTVPIFLYLRDTDGELEVPSQYGNIQGAINASLDGDMVIVDANTYNEDIKLNGRNITLRSIDPGDPNVTARTVIQGTGTGPVVTIASGESENCHLSGFTITGGNNQDSGGGILCIGTSPTINNCIIRDNIAVRGAGLSNDGGTLTVNNCIFSGNVTSAYGGGGIYNNNFANITISNCIFADNSGGGGGGIANYNSSSAVVTNCTFFGNSAYKETSGGGAVRCHISSDMTMSNCIAWGNTGVYGQEISVTSASTLTIAYSDVKGGSAGVYVPSGSTLDWSSGNINIDPELVDPNNGDFHLMVGSPCIEAGDPNYVAEPNEVDIDGEARISGYRVDMGADEFQISGPLCWACRGQCHADANCDYVVNTGDWPSYRDSFQKSYPDPDYNPCGDYNRDGIINTSDWPAFRDNFQSVPAADCGLGGTWPPI